MLSTFALAAALTVFTGALLTSCAVIFLSLESRKEVILALLRGEQDPRFGASLRDRAAGLRPQPASPFSRSSIPSPEARP